MYARLLGLVTGLCLTLAAALAQAPPKPLSEKENPLRIGQRDINKHQINFYSLRKEVELGRRFAAEIERQVELVTDPMVTEYVNRVGQNIVQHSDAKVVFTIKVIDTTEVNAFALPGGILYVTRGLLEFADNEAELVSVMAHEVAHVAARHGVEQASKAKVADVASLALGSLGGLGGLAIGQVANLALPLGLLRSSRGAEKEADLLGAQYAWAAGYDPQALIAFIERFEAHDNERLGFIARAFSTHPVMSDRVKKLRQLLERFPEQPEYIINDSKFIEVQARALSLTPTLRLHRDPEAPNRPTLKRNPSSPNAADDVGSEKQSSDHPVLKRLSQATKTQMLSVPANGERQAIDVKKTLFCFCARGAVEISR